MVIFHSDVKLADGTKKLRGRVAQHDKVLLGPADFSQELMVQAQQAVAKVGSQCQGMLAGGPSVFHP